MTYNFPEPFLFGMKYLCLLVPQTDMSHLRFDFFSRKKSRRICQLERFIQVGLSRKKQNKK